MTVIDHAMVARSRDHLSQQRNAFTAFLEDCGNFLNLARLDDGDHADAAVESAQQLRFGDTPLSCQPPEYRQHRQAGKVDPDAEMSWQHARNIIGEPAAGDVSKALDRAGL